MAAWADVEGKGLICDWWCTQAEQTFKDYLHFRRNTANRGTRRRREEDRAAVSDSFLLAVLIHKHKISDLVLSLCLFHQRPVPLTEMKVSPPKFDLAATNFPPLPGCVVSTQGEPVLETRMSDVVRGLYKDKVRQSVLETSFVINTFICKVCSSPSSSRLNKPIK